MAQSVELVLDRAAETAVLDQWERLYEAGLPTARRSQPSPHHRPHVTLFAGERISETAEEELVRLFGDGTVLAGLPELRIGALTLFGPRRGSYVLVRQLVGSVPLLQLQADVAARCGALRGGQFGPGRWTPHVTLARRIAAHQVGPALQVLEAASDDLPARAVRCRRWDGEARTAWWLGPA